MAVKVYLCFQLVPQLVMCRSFHVTAKQLNLLHSMKGIKTPVMLSVQKYAKYDILPGLHSTTIQFNAEKTLKTLKVNYNVIKQTNQNFLTGLTSLFITGCIDSDQQLANKLEF